MLKLEKTHWSGHGFIFACANLKGNQQKELIVLSAIKSITSVKRNAVLSNLSWRHDYCKVMIAGQRIVSRVTSASAERLWHGPPVLRRLGWSVMTVMRTEHTERF
jgi:hypothetical protein